MKLAVTGVRTMSETGSVPAVVEVDSSPARGDARAAADVIRSASASVAA